LNISTALRQGAAALEKEGLTVPRLTAEVLLAHALGCERVYLYAHPEQELSAVQQIHYGRYLHERLKRKPTQYITGRQEFYGREFRVTPAVLIPRPETEVLVEEALRRIAASDRVLDVGTGSGCLAVTLQLESPQADVFASDVSREALAVAAENARRLQAPVRFFCGELLEAAGAGRFDVILSNPPYIPLEDVLPPEVAEYEPALALRAGVEGTAVYRPLAEDAARVLRPGGWLILELGHGSRGKVERFMDDAWSESVVHRDLAGIERVLAVRKRTGF
jgi:release factor glutamine methyltransferase